MRVASAAAWVQVGAGSRQLESGARARRKTLHKSRARLARLWPRRRGRNWPDAIWALFGTGVVGRRARASRPAARRAHSGPPAWPPAGANKGERQAARARCLIRFCARAISCANSRAALTSSRSYALALVRPSYHSDPAPVSGRPDMNLQICPPPPLLPALGASRQHARPDSTMLCVRVCV